MIDSRLIKRKEMGWGGFQNKMEMEKNEKWGKLNGGVVGCECTCECGGCEIEWKAMKRGNFGW